MTTTDTDALQERLRNYLIEQFAQQKPRPEFATVKSVKIAGLVAPFIAAEVQAASEKAWGEGCVAAEQYYKRTAIGVPGSDPIPAPLNPHRETGDRA